MLFDHWKLLIFILIIYTRKFKLIACIIGLVLK